MSNKPSSVETNVAVITVLLATSIAMWILNYGHAEFPVVMAIGWILQELVKAWSAKHNEM